MNSAIRIFPLFNFLALKLIQQNADRRMPAVLIECLNLYLRLLLSVVHKPIDAVQGLFASLFGQVDRAALHIQVGLSLQLHKHFSMLLHKLERQIVGVQVLMKRTFFDKDPNERRNLIQTNIEIKMCI